MIAVDNYKVLKGYKTTERDPRRRLWTSFLKAVDSTILKQLILREDQLNIWGCVDKLIEEKWTVGLICKFYLKNEKTGIVRVQRGRYKNGLEW